MRDAIQCEQFRIKSAELNILIITKCLEPAVVSRTSLSSSLRKMCGEEDILVTKICFMHAHASKQCHCDDIIARILGAVFFFLNKELLS